MIEAPQDPINPPPHASHLAATINGTRPATIPGMGHAISTPVIKPLAETILSFTASVNRHPRGTA